VTGGPLRRGVLLANLGSPDGYDVASVRRYLNEFLMDPHVLDLPWPIRRFIVSGLILPTRPKKSSRAYSAVWRKSNPGSPLVYFSEQLTNQVRRSTNIRVALGMRYGSPSLQTAITSLGEVDEIFLIPMYPQHASSTRTTTIERVKSLSNVPVRVMPPFYDDPAFLNGVARLLQSTMEPTDFVLFSYHGLPERHITKADPTGSHCLTLGECCQQDSPAHKTCYRYQCFATTEALVKRLGLERHATCFQSRLGRLPWLKPYTDELLKTLPSRGVRDLTVVCPAFTADNLETLEEIGIRGRKIFSDAGGKSFRVAPCLNDDTKWAHAIAAWCENIPDENAFDRTSG
jgi:ferrochelatase